MPALSNLVLTDTLLVFLGTQAIAFAGWAGWVSHQIKDGIRRMERIEKELWQLHDFKIRVTAFTDRDTGTNRS